MISHKEEAARTPQVCVDSDGHVHRRRGVEIGRVDVVARLDRVGRVGEAGRDVEHLRMATPIRVIARAIACRVHASRACPGSITVSMSRSSSRSSMRSVPFPRAYGSRCGASCAGGGE